MRRQAPSLLCMLCFLRRHGGSHAFDHHVSVLVGAYGVQLDDILFRKQFPDGTGRRDGVPDIDRLGEFQLLAQIDSAGPRQLHAQHCGDKTGPQDAVGNPAAELGLAGGNLVGVGGIEIAGDAGKQVYVRLGHGLGHAGAVAQLHSPDLSLQHTALPEAADMMEAHL